MKRPKGRAGESACWRERRSLCAAAKRDENSNAALGGMPEGDDEDNEDQD